jgi:predicted alpha/beta hydrolase
MLAVYATDDRYAPAKAVQALNRKYYNANVKQHVIEVGKAGMDEVGHFGYFRDRMRDTLWRHMVNWLNKTEDAPR